MFGRTLTSAFWGVVADRYGRKPVIIFGTSVVYVCLILIELFTFRFPSFQYQCVYIYFRVWFEFRVVFNTLFGLSTNFWMAVITRFLLGSLNGLLGQIKVFCYTIKYRVSSVILLAYLPFMFRHMLLRFFVKNIKH